MPDLREKPPLLFATPRSGSYPVYAIILEYLERVRNVEGLLEFLNIGTHSCESSDGKILTYRFPHEVTAEEAGRLYSSPGAAKIAARVMEHRLGLIEERPERYFFKVFPYNLGLEHVIWLSNRFELIFLERKNLWEQLLSFMISLHTGQWYETGGLRWAEKSIEADFGYFMAFEKTIELYSSYKEALRPKSILTYEEFLSGGPKAVLEKAGLREPLELSLSKVSPRQNPPNKERAFSNVEELRSWYDQSSLPGKRLGA